MRSRRYEIRALRSEIDELHIYHHQARPWDKHQKYHKAEQRLLLAFNPPKIRTMSATFGGYTGGALPTPRGPSGGGGGSGGGSRGRNRDRRNHKRRNRRRSSGGRSWSRSRSRSRSRDREDSDDQEERERKWTREGSRSHRKASKSSSNQSRRPVPSVEGWIVLITNVHKEAQEDDLREMFGEFGEIQNCHLNLDRKTGYCKGYALVEYEKKSMADEAIEKCHKEELLGQTIGVEFAFVAPPDGGGGGGYGGRGPGGGYGGRRGGGRGGGGRYGRRY